MSLEQLTMALADPDVTGSHRLVLIALADTASDDGVCWVRCSVIARKANVSDRTVRRCLDDLAEYRPAGLGRIVVQDRPGRSSVYRLALRWEWVQEAHAIERGTPRDAWAPYPSRDESPVTRDRASPVTRDRTMAETAAESPVTRDRAPGHRWPDTPVTRDLRTRKGTVLEHAPTNPDTFPTPTRTELGRTPDAPARWEIGEDGLARWTGDGPPPPGPAPRTWT